MLTCQVCGVTPVRIFDVPNLGDPTLDFLPPSGGFSSTAYIARCFEHRPQIDWDEGELDAEESALAEAEARAHLLSARQARQARDRGQFPSAARVAGLETSTQEHRTVILQSEYLNAVYDEGRLRLEGKPDTINAETVAAAFLGAAWYFVPDEVYDAVLDGQGYPEELAQFPLSRCRKVR